MIKTIQAMKLYEAAKAFIELPTLEPWDVDAELAFQALANAVAAYEMEPVFGVCYVCEQAMALMVKHDNSGWQIVEECPVCKAPP